MQSCITALLALVAMASNSQNIWFVSLFIFRYLRLIVHIFSFNFLYRMTSIPKNPTVHPRDCTVIVPSIDPSHAHFTRNLESILINGPRSILIVTVGKSNLRLLEEITAPLQRCFPRTSIYCLKTDVANKRGQVCHSIPMVETEITVLLDDSVYWSSANFLRAAIAPFESPRVGCVGTHKRVIRNVSGIGFESFFNFLGCIYLERHNFDIRATNAIDGGVFVVSGRTSLIRTQIVQDSEFISGFTNERFFWDRFGPLNADDDNFITRWLVNHDWDIKIQYGGDATIETRLGTYPRYMSQVLRWTRTTWRSNPRSLFIDRTIWYRQPWCVYAVHLTSLVNFSLFYDLALVFSLTSTTFFSSNTLYCLAAWIFASKMVKLIAHFRRCPSDIIYIPGYIVFAYYHSFIKLFALLTFYEVAWGGRNLAVVGKDDEETNTTASVSPFVPTVHTTPPGHRSERRPVPTPWGEVKNNANSSAIPANVLESRLARTKTLKLRTAPTTPQTTSNDAANKTKAQLQREALVAREEQMHAAHLMNEDYPAQRTAHGQHYNHTHPHTNANSGKLYATKIEYTHAWFDFGSFTRALTWFTGRKANVQTKTFPQRLYPNGPQRDWWKHAEEDQSFDFFEHKNDLRKDEDYEVNDDCANDVVVDVDDEKEWFRREMKGRLESR